MTISELKELKHVDSGVVDAMHKFLLWGLDPGRMGRLCLLEDYDSAWSAAHPTLRLAVSDNENLVENLVNIACYLPSHCRGSDEQIDNWIAHQGLFGAALADRAIIKLQWSQELLGEFPSEEYFIDFGGEV